MIARFGLLVLLAACQRVPVAKEPTPAEYVQPPVSDPASPPEVVPPLAYSQRWVGGAAEGDAVPVVVVVHGLGDTPDHFAWVVEDWSMPARVVLPQAPTPFGQGFAWMTVRSAEGRDAELAAQLTESASRVASLADDLSRDSNTVGKPVVAGFSQGGMIAYAVAVLHPDSVAAAVPVSGWLPEPLLPATGQRVARIRALHGDADPIIDVSRARETVDRLRSAGADAELEVFEGVPHLIPRPVRTRMEAQVTALAGSR